MVMADFQLPWGQGRSGEGEAAEQVKHSRAILALTSWTGAIQLHSETLKTQNQAQLILMILSTVLIVFLEVLIL